MLNVHVSKTNAAEQKHHSYDIPVVFANETTVDGAIRVIETYIS